MTEGIFEGSIVYPQKIGVAFIWRAKWKRILLMNLFHQKDTRAYLHSIHYEFTDLEKATIVANHIMISYEKKSRVVK